jgi:hypothetical protein
LERAGRRPPGPTGNQRVPWNQYPVTTESAFERETEGRIEHGFEDVGKTIHWTRVVPPSRRSSYGIEIGIEEGPPTTGSPTAMNGDGTRVQGPQAMFPRKGLRMKSEYVASGSAPERV